MLYRVHPAWVEFELTTLVVIGTDCIGMKGGFSVWFYWEEWITCATDRVFLGAPHMILVSCPADEIHISWSGNVIVYMPEELQL